MKKSYILPILAAGLLFAGCSKENPFGGESSTEEGQVLKSALAVTLNTDETVRQQKPTRGDVNLNDFTVVFTKDGAPVAKYKYSEMPEVVTLPAGEYTCSATYGENRVAEWESPYYLGQSGAFTVEPMEITSYIDPIECRLENVKVTVTFDPVLVSRMSPDSYVEVRVGANDGLNFTTAEASSGKAGYFLHTAETTLVATFYGAIDGSQTTETKSYNNIQRGCHYKLNFKLHLGGDGEGVGDANNEVVLDATVTTVDVERDVTVEDEPMTPDWSEHPGNGNGSGSGDTPGTGDDEPKAPSITAEAPVNLDIVNDGSSLTSCVLNIHSYAEDGITGLTCDIVSPNLTEGELTGVGLSSHLDLVNPGSMVEGLKGLGLPYNVGGEKDVRFDISTFMGMLSAVGAGNQHQFVITVTDANGTTTKTLKIQF